MPPKARPGRRGAQPPTTPSTIIALVGAQPSDPVASDAVLALPIDNPDSPILLDYISDTPDSPLLGDISGDVPALPAIGGDDADAGLQPLLPGSEGDLLAVPSGSEDPVSNHRKSCIQLISVWRLTSRYSATVHAQLGLLHGATAIGLSMLNAIDSHLTVRRGFRATNVAPQSPCTTSAMPDSAKYWITPSDSVLDIRIPCLIDGGVPGIRTGRYFDLYGDKVGWLHEVYLAIF